VRTCRKSDGMKGSLTAVVGGEAPKTHARGSCGAAPAVRRRTTVPLSRGVEAGAAESAARRGV